MAETEKQAVIALLLQCLEEGIADDALAEAMERCRRKQAGMKGERQ